VADHLPKEIIDKVQAIDSGNDVDTEFINLLATGLVPVKMTNKEKLSPHGKEVIDQILEEGTIGDFIKGWRKNFLENEIKFLPDGWRIDHKIFRNFGEHSQYANDNELKDKLD
jgi:hypothetical protein